ncbi:hypothetical protein EDD29_4849 [Actinocorallia herbida]|uniref:Uncharacterized protein n=1 Tax=Actinocorallia herbida TaxID=58109 RepID=A0A3N1D146_9ACTN|nr:hypothetical protein [Actinocorallia herbida]ROO87255.1 hypothetical protein EDD29_4849 [Actinocorallia herbida]
MATAAAPSAVLIVVLARMHGNSITEEALRQIYRVAVIVMIVVMAVRGHLGGD